jgi:hypothetical protein
VTSTHGFDVKLLALDLAGLDHLLSEHRQARLIAQGHADFSQAPHQQPLGKADLGHGAGRRCQVEAPVRPIAGLPDIVVIAAIHAEIMSHNRRMSKLFAADSAVIEGGIRRTAFIKLIGMRCSQLLSSAKAQECTQRLASAQGATKYVVMRGIPFR